MDNRLHRASGLFGADGEAGEALRVGHYELVFAAGDYFAAQGVALPAPRFEGLPCIFEGPGTAGKEATAEDIAIANALRERGLASRR